MKNNTLLDNLKGYKKKRDAVILAHNYTIREVQDAADFCGDSLELAKKAKTVTQKVILFCGVRFMAETAKILNPEKTVLMPDYHAGCPMADMISAEDVRRLRNTYPGAAVICYVNSTAEVKAESDVCCTSSNAASVVGKFPVTQPVVFVPDKFLGRFVASQLNRSIHCWEGYCPVHQRINPEMIAESKIRYPGAEVIVHPECHDKVCATADKVLSTGQMIAYLKEKQQGTFIIGTETGMLYPLQKNSPSAGLYAVSDEVICPNMKKNTLKKMVSALEKMETVVTVSEDIALRARKSLEAML